MASFQAGDTFLLGGLGGLDAKLHLFVVVCDPAGNPLTILAVPFNTVTSSIFALFEEGVASMAFFVENGKRQPSISEEKPCPLLLSAQVRHFVNS